MKRDLQRMASKTYDLVVVGGGITGACIARDAAMRGLSVALIDKGDFACATTAASSKLIHGGLRYLQNLEIGLVRESLRERRIWSNIAPHMIDPLTFLMPVGKERIRDRMTKAIALTLYDWLGYDRRRTDDPDKAIPAHEKLDRAETLEREPGLESDDLTGAMVFYDYQMHSPERLALECVLSAAEHGADVANYAGAVGFVREDGRVTGVRVQDVAPGPHNPSPEMEVVLRGRLIVNATGPWADILMASLHDTDAAPRRLLRSKGIHILTRALTREHAIAVPGDAGHFFILPWRGLSLLGTTDTPYDGDPDKVHVTEKDIIDFLAVVNKGHPGANLRRVDVLHFYCGLRPIVDTTAAELSDTAAASGSYTASRASEVFDHETEENIQGIISAIGGKWTTSRGLAEHVVDLAVSKLDLEPTPCTTHETPTYGGDVGRFPEFSRRMLDEHGDLPSALVEHLARNYGARLDDLVRLLQEDPELSNPVAEDNPAIVAQIVHAVRNEMALTVEDVLFRRTGLGNVGSPVDQAIDKVGEVMALELGWDEAERTAQIERAVARFRSWARTRAIVNPFSWGKRTGSVWPAIEGKLRHAIGPIETVYTDQPMAAARLTAEALEEGIEQIISVGGDGTVNEVVNGFFKDGRPINPDALLAIIMSGTGGDLRRTLGLSADVEGQIERLAVSEIHPIDLGKLTFIAPDGSEQVRLFGNVASFGLSGAAGHAVNRLTIGKMFSGNFAFQWGLAKATLAYRNRRVRIQVDDVYDEVVDVTAAAVCNGQFFGSGMHVAPYAQLNDGLFDVIIAAGMGPFSLAWNIGALYKGKHFGLPYVTALRGSKITATPVDDETRHVLLDVDGETPGRLPATFEILPNAIYLRR